MTEKNVKCHHEEAFCKVQTLENYKISNPIPAINKLKEERKKKERKRGADKLEETEETSKNVNQFIFFFFFEACRLRMV